MARDLSWEPSLSALGFSLANSKEAWQEREMVTLHVAASETQVFRSSTSSQDVRVLLVPPALSAGRVEGAVPATLGVR